MAGRSDSRLKQQSSANGGFTLLEVLVVVVIIIILAAILVPALSAVKRKARETDVKAQLSGISSGCESYFSIFDAYPGPAPVGQTTNAAGPTGSQNLLLALAYTMEDTTNDYYNGTKPPPAMPGGTVTIPGTITTLKVDPNSPFGVINRSASTPSTVNSNALGPTPTSIYRTHPVFYTFTQKEISSSDGASPPVWPFAGISITPSPSSAWRFPVILDKFSDPLPVLYFRKTPGFDGTATAANNAVTSSPNTIVSKNAPAGLDAAYYLRENSVYTADGTSLTSPTNVNFPQGNYTLNSKQFSYDDKVLATKFSNISGTTATARGGYALISAGSDRYFGNVDNVSDDIVVIGGH